MIIHLKTKKVLSNKINFCCDEMEKECSKSFTPELFLDKVYIPIEISYKPEPWKGKTTRIIGIQFCPFCGAKIRCIE